MDLDIAAAALTTRLSTHRLATTTEPAARALALCDPGLPAGPGRSRAQTLAATTEAVEVYRRLAGLNPAAFEPDLARGFWSFAWVRAAGQIELQQALTAAEESVTRYDGLVQQLSQALIKQFCG